MALALAIACSSSGGDGNGNAGDDDATAGVSGAGDSGGASGAGGGVGPTAGKPATGGSGADGGSDPSAAGAAGDDSGAGGTNPTPELDPEGGAGGDPGDSAGGAPSNGDLADCSARAQLICQRWFECDPYRALLEYATEQACRAQHRTFCAELAVQDQEVDLAACGAALAAPNCAGFFGATVPSSCTLPLGDRALAADCAVDSECQSGFCDRKGECGTCAARRPEGVECEWREQCAQGLICDTTCQPPRAPGASCDGVWQCGPREACVDGTCTTKGAADASCTTSDTCESGTTCQSGTCVSIVIAGEGDTCNSMTACGAQLECVSSNPLAPAKCEKLPTLGEPCTSRCGAPFTCADEQCALTAAGACEP